MRGILRLGDILIEQGVITEHQLNESLYYQKQTGARLGDSLVALGHATADQIAAALSWQGTYGLTALCEINSDPCTAELLTEKFCRARRVLPIRFNSRGTLVLAMVDPNDILTVDDVRLITGCEVSPVPVTLEGFEEALFALYGQKKRLESASAEERETDGPSSREMAEYEGVISLVNDILATAVRQEASDIHLEPHAEGLVVRIRIDGMLHHITDIRKEIKDGVVSRIKILGDIDIAEKRLPQDGRATFHLDDNAVDLRIATVPTVFGENVTIRLLNDRRQKLSLEDVGMEGKDLSLFRAAIRQPWGGVLITGPTGSGKSTTLYAGLEELNQPGVKIYTVEDPVERVIPGIMQSQIRPIIGLNFASMLRSLVRGDPDIIMIGEIRDRETALIASEASLTGHLVLSTLHTNDAASAVTRLLEMGLPPYLISSGIVCIVAQRLARRLCPRCKQTVIVEPDSMSPRELKLLGPVQAEISRAVGCKNCFNSGYRGRVGLFEVLPVDAELRELILSQASADRLREHAVRMGMRTLREDGRRKVLAGLTTAEEVERLTT
jgi:type IV pilus assembly protein PilB